jgi:hypothetical protein
MRIPLPTDLKTRTGAPDKDARQKNSYVETKGEGAIVRKRPSAQGGIPIGTGVAQGGIGININGTPSVIGFWGDTMQTYTGGGTSWDSSVSYIYGSMVSVDFEDYYGKDVTPNIDKPPKSNPTYWTKTPTLPIIYSSTTSAVTGPFTTSQSTVSSDVLIASYKVIGGTLQLREAKSYSQTSIPNQFQTKINWGLFNFGAVAQPIMYGYGDTSQASLDNFYATNPAASSFPSSAVISGGSTAYNQGLYCTGVSSSGLGVYYASTYTGTCTGLLLYATNTGDGYWQTNSVTLYYLTTTTTDYSIVVP